MGFGLGRRGLKTPKNVGLRVCPQGPRGTAQRDLKVKGRRTDLKGRHTGDLESQRSFQLLLTPAIWIILS